MGHDAEVILAFQKPGVGHSSYDQTDGLIIS